MVYGLSIFNQSNETTETPMELSQIHPVEIINDELTTKQAAERYGCENNYSTFHNRMVKLKIKPERRGRKSFLNQEQINLLDRCDDHLKSGKYFADFIIDEEKIGTLTMKEQSYNLDLSGSSMASIEKVGTNNEISFLEALKIYTNANYDVLSPQKRLLEASQNKFLLTTEQVSKIVGLSSSTISSWKSGTKKLGFLFHRSKEGNYVVWSVNRDEL